MLYAVTVILRTLSGDDESASSIIPKISEDPEVNMLVEEAISKSRDQQ